MDGTFIHEKPDIVRMRLPVNYKQVKEATSSSIRKKMDDVRLRADYENLQNLMNRIPPEILELAKRGQLTHSDRER